jgi:hypothetical protein
VPRLGGRPGRQLSLLPLVELELRQYQHHQQQQLLLLLQQQQPGHQAQPLRVRR